MVFSVYQKHPTLVSLPQTYSLFFQFKKESFLKQFYLTWCDHFCQILLPLFIYRCLSLFLNIWFWVFLTTLSKP